MSVSCWNTYLFHCIVVIIIYFIIRYEIQQLTDRVLFKYNPADTVVMNQCITDLTKWKILAVLDVYRKN